MANNRSLLSGIADRVKRGQDTGAAATSSGELTGEAAAGHFAANLDGVTNPRAPGQRQAKIQRTDIQRLLWVDPKVCRLWAHHNRDYSLLSEDRCGDLISGFRAQGRQQRAAIVRSLTGDDRVGSDGIQYDFEIISGARRHWTVSWLRSRDETNKEGDPFLFLVQVRDDLNVTGAFELSDAENRGQKDISDFERAKEYRWALTELYEDNVSRMAESIEMDRSHLIRLLALTEMPVTIVQAYPSILDIRVHHWRELSPYFSSHDRQKKEASERILACARSIAQARAANSQNVPQDGAETARLLIAAIKEKSRGGDRTQTLQTISAKATGKVMLKIKRTTRGMTFEVPRTSGATKEEVVEAMSRAVEEFFEA